MNSIQSQRYQLLHFLINKETKLGDGSLQVQLLISENIKSHERFQSDMRSSVCVAIHKAIALRRGSLIFHFYYGPQQKIIQATENRPSKQMMNLISQSQLSSIKEIEAVRYAFTQYLFGFQRFLQLLYWALRTSMG